MKKEGESLYTKVLAKKDYERQHSFMQQELKYKCEELEKTFFDNFLKKEDGEDGAGILALLK